MPKPLSLAPLAALAAAFFAAPAPSGVAAEALRCQSVNGSVTCAGSGAVSCQTINGRTVCVGGRGEVVQSFGNTRQAVPGDGIRRPDVRLQDDLAGDIDDADPPEEMAPDDRLVRPSPSAPHRGLSIERWTPGGHRLWLERDGTRLRLRTNRLNIEID